jgi:ribonucleoside-triphosphate reductase
LSAAVMRAEDTVETFSEKVRVATWIGTIQATFTNFPYLRPAWKKHCDEDRLLGVDITGHCDNPKLSGDAEAMTHFNKIARSTAAEASAHFNIPMPAMITCGKPSGNSSQAVDCASGFHTRYSKYYIRRVRISGADPLFRLIRDSGAPVFKDVKYKNAPDAECPTWVVEFPVKAPEGCMTRSDETALEQLGRYLNVMNTWISKRGHNQSATVYVRDHEWDVVGDWVYEHFDEITGLAFLPYDGGVYELAPYEEIDASEYNRRQLTFPNVDYSLLSQYETEDMGEGAQTLACMGGSCEIDFSELTEAT